jgi:hypothetical protein
MMGVVDDYVVTAPGTLSHRAVDFLQANSRRVGFDRGPTGDRLRRQIIAVYGEPKDRIVDLLDRLQARYGGLSYRSGFFETDVVFSPVCEPEDAEEELEILYAVQTGSPAGASVKVDGSVEIGLDGAGVVEFASLDTLIESDSMFFAAAHLPVREKRYLDNLPAAELVDRLRSDKSLGLAAVDNASGAHTVWFEGDSKVVFVSDVWQAMGALMPPFMIAAAGAQGDIAGLATVTR